MGSPGRTQAEKIQALQSMLENYQPGESGLLPDSSREEALAPVKAKATRLINHRARSVHELRERLLRDECEPEAVDEVIARCLSNGLLDDERFASEWVRQRQANQHKSVAVLRRELKTKGVDSAVIDRALEQVDERDQDAIMRGLVEKKAASIRNIPQDRREYDKLLKRVVGVAARRGFPEGRALSAAREALDARIEELGG